MRKRIVLLFFSVCFLMSFTSITSPQKMMQQTLTIENGDIYSFEEVGAICSDSDDCLEIKMLLPKNLRLKQYFDVDLQQGDKILMLNSKRVKSVNDFKDQYNSLKIGAELKLGIKRCDEMRIVSLDKVDPEKLPKQKMIVMKHDENIKLLIGTGLIFEEKNGQVMASEIMPHSKDMIGDVDIMKGDIVIAINGKKVSSFNELETQYESLNLQDQVKLSLLRDTKTISVSFIKTNKNVRNMSIKSTGNHK